MSSTRAIAILVLVGGLSILTVQNLSPAVPLIFLGARLPTLPLSLWMLIAIAAGAFTAIIISSFYPVSPATSRRRPSSPPPDSPKPPVEPSGVAGTSEWKSDNDDSENWVSSPPPPQPEPPQSEAKAGKTDDWETEVCKVGPQWEDGENWVDTGDTESEPPPRSSENWTDPSQEPFNPHHSGGEWGNETAPEEQPAPAPEEPEPAPNNYETQQVPDKESWSGSVYSFGYRNSEESGVGRQESVFDADYRLITPPGSQPTQIQSDKEDWDFEDDDLEGETPPRR